MRPVVRPVLRDVMSPSHISDSIKYALFSSGEQGAYYDLYDQSTLFQDAAGTTPWTTLGQPLGLQLDKRLGLALGSEQLSTGSAGLIGSATAATYNSSTGAGSVTRVDLSNQSYVVLNGTTEKTWYRVSITNTGASTLTLRNIIAAVVNTTLATVTAGQSFSGYVFTDAASKVGVAASSGTATFTISSVREIAGNHRYQTTPASRPTIEARVNRLVGTETLATQNVTTVAGGYILRFTGAGTVTLSGTAVGAYSAGTHSITCTAGTLTATVAGTVTQADLRLSLDSAYPYQRVTTATDYADIGAPRRIKYDGIDDFLRTASVDFSATDKMTVWAGVRKLSDATSMVVESGTDVGSVNGTFALYVSSGMRYGSRGTSTRTAIHASSAVSNEVVTAYSSITTDACSLRINGALVANDSADQGTGNFGNYPLYFGSRAGTSLRFSGEVFSPEVIRGAASNGAQIDMVERIINKNMGGVY
jgi:hypothetical protein